MVENKKQKLSFLDSFSEEEFDLSGHKKDDLPYLLNIFESLLPYIKGGKYLELGCGSGILCSFIYTFSKKKIVPYGVDINPKAIALAKKNNLKFENNFIVSDYFNLDTSFFLNFSTISIFVSDVPDTKKIWCEKLYSLLTRIKPKIKKTRVIIFSYGQNLLKVRDSGIIEFTRMIEKSFKVTSINKNFFILNLR